MARTTDRAQRGGHSGVSIEDVAAAAGVSTATVSRAVRGLPRVSPATREKILEVHLRNVKVTELKYRPDGSIVTIDAYTE